MPPPCGNLTQIPYRASKPFSLSTRNAFRPNWACLAIRQRRPIHSNERTVQTAAQFPCRKRLGGDSYCRHRRHAFTTSSLNADAERRGPDRVAGSHESVRNKLKSKDRGPASQEETQTDFGALNVLGSIPPPTSSVDVCLYDGFQLDSGLQVGEGDGVMLVGGEGFVWRPWMASANSQTNQSVINGAMMKGATEVERSGGVINSLGQFEVKDTGWGVFNMLWPRPDLLIIGTGPTIRPLAPSTRSYLQQLGMRLEVLDTRNAASQFNMLATERGVTEVAAALVPIGFALK